MIEFLFICSSFMIVQSCGLVSMNLSIFHASFYDCDVFKSLESSDDKKLFIQMDDQSHLFELKAQSKSTLNFS